MNLGALFQMKQAWGTFAANHPKVPDFAAQIKNKGFCEVQEIAVAVRYPDGTEYKTGIRLKASDLELLNSLK